MQHKGMGVSCWDWASTRLRQREGIIFFGLPSTGSGNGLRELGSQTFGLCSATGGE